MFIAAIGRFFKGIAQAWLIAGISLLLLLLVDQLLRALLADPAAWAQLDPAAHAPPRERAQAVAGSDWIDAYWREHAASKDSDWHSFVYWRRKPYAGQLVHIDAHGFRTTTHITQAPQHTLWLFGGSVAWGTGNRDSGTLAAQLEQVYAERSPELSVRVLNFGESGYVSRQSLTAFQLALACPRPAADLALFLDGANDVYASLQTGRAGLPQNENNRVLEFNSSRNGLQQLKAWAYQLQGLARLVAAPAPQWNAEQIAQLGAATAQEYLATARQAQALGAAYQVDVLSAFQPTAFDRTPARADETAIVAASPALHVQLQRATRAALQAQMATQPELAVADLGAVLDASDSAYFFDFVHLSEQGQRVLAEHLYALTVARLAARPARAPTVDRCGDRPLD